MKRPLLLLSAVLFALGLLLAGLPSVVQAQTLDAPTNLVATATSATEIHLQWDASAGAVSYQAQIKKTTDSDWFTGRQPVTDTEITFGSGFTIEGGVSYDLRVRSCADAQATDCSGWSATATLRTPLAELTPRNFRVASTGTTSVTLQWDSPPTRNNQHPDGYDFHKYSLSGYPVQWRQYVAGQGAGEGWGAAEIVPEGASITKEVTGLEPGTAYDFRVRSEAVDIGDLDPNPANTIRHSPYVLLENQQTHVDYDADGDGLIDITNLAQLNAIRYDLDGNGMVTDDPSTMDINEADEYAAAFPAPLSGMGCPDTDDPDSDPGPCLGYELLNDLDFDTGTVGDRTDDDYYNGGSGWEPIGKDNPANDSVRYNAVFEGNGNTISNLFISRSSTNDVGLFGALGTAGVIRNLGVVDASVTGQQYVGALAGNSYGSIERSYASGTVSGSSNDVGGLAGYNEGSISYSYAAGTVSATADRVGGLLGQNVGSVSYSYATAAVNGADAVGGLVGQNRDNGTIVASYATGPVTGNVAGGLVGDSQNSTARIIASYATGPVSGSSWAGGLIGEHSHAWAIASYATGPVQGGIRVGGFTGAVLTPDFVHIYYDTETTGRNFPVGADDNNDRDNDDPTDNNNVLDSDVGESVRYSEAAKLTDELQSPTGYTGIYANWRDIDLDGDANTPDMNDFWHFGTGSQYPALKADLNGDGMATWQEFGFQVRDDLALELTDETVTAPAISWSEVAAPTEWGTPGPDITYRVHRSGAVIVESQSGTTHSDTGLADGPEYAYRVTALVNGVPARASNVVRVGGYDRDGDGLIDIRNLAQLDAIRYDLDGNGDPSTGNETAYAMAFPNEGQRVCPVGSTCIGYELLNDLDFNDPASYASGQVSAAWTTGEGWLPIAGSGVSFNGTLQGNGYVIAHLYANRTVVQDQGFFRQIDTAGVVSHLGLTNVNVTSGAEAGALVARNNGTISAVYVTGSVTGADNTGGIAGISDGIISNSYVAGFVSGANNVGGVVGNVDPFLSSDNPRVVASYSTASVSGTDKVGGLVGLARAAQADVNVIASYAAGPVTGTGSNVGGLVGQSVTAGGNSVNVTDSYFDTDLTGQTHATRGRTTDQLQDPTGYADIYANWRNLDVDGDGTADTNDFWHFGNTSQYPALKADFSDPDTTATWPEFGFQLRERPALTLDPDADGTGASLSWTAVDNTHWTPNPALAYRVRKNGAELGNPVDAPATSTRDEAFTPDGDYDTRYRVEALLDGAYARAGNTVTPEAPTVIDLQLTPDSVNEGDGSATTITVTAAYRGGGALATATTVNVTVTEGSATAGTDYTATSPAVITIPAEQNSGTTTFSITPIQDNDSEGNETITVNGSYTGDLTGTATATLTLVDDDLPAVTFSLTSTTINEGGVATLTATISRAVDAVTTINVLASPSAAVQLSGTTLTIPAQLTASSGSGITVTAVDDSRDNADVTVTLSGTVAQSGITAPAPVMLTITDDDDPPVLSVDSPTVQEGDSGKENLRFTFTLSPASGRTVTAHVRDLGSGTATSGTDYDAIHAWTLTFQPGETSKPFTVFVNGDNFAEEDETVALAVDSLVNVEFGTGFFGTGTTRTAGGTINNDDDAPTSINLSVRPSSVNEADSATTITVTAAFNAGSGTLETDTTLSVVVGAASDGATEGTDYQTIGDLTLTIAAGATSVSGTRTLTPIQDSASEGSETISVTAIHPTLTVNTATLTLVDDDISASIEATDPATLTERTLDGARLTVDLVATEYASPLEPSDFGLQLQPPGTQGLSIASVNRVNDERAVLTLSFDGDIESDLELRVAVDAAAHTADGTLTTGARTVTPALTPGQVMGVTVTPGPGSFTVTWNAVANADGYIVSWGRSAVEIADHTQQVRDGSTTSATIGDLPGETYYLGAVAATSDFAPDGPFSNEFMVTTLPAHAIISATDPSPLTENNLGGARLTVRLLRNVWFADGPLHASYFGVSGVPGVSVAGVERLSDTDVAVTIAYDVTDPATDFDEDATLTVRIDGCAFYRCPTRISAITPVAAVVEPPPAKVENVRVTPGPRYISVRWDEVSGANVNPDAGGYIVTWSPAHACGFNGWSRYEIRRSTITRYSIGALCPGTEYTVQVIAIRERAPNGQASAAVSATTPAFSYRLAGTEPSSLTGANLHGAAVLIDLQGAVWTGAARERVKLSGINTRMWVDRVEQVSSSRLKVVLGNRGPWPLEGGNLTVTVYADLHTWNRDVAVTVPVAAVEPAGGLRVTEVTDTSITVAWDRVEGNNVYYLVRWKHTGSTGGWVHRWTRLTSHKLRGSRDYITPNTQYTVQVRSLDRGGAGFGQWSDEVTATTGATSPAQRASVTVTAADPVAVNEGGRASYTVVLDGQPTGNVVIAMSSDNADVTAQPASLTFTTDNWQTAQTVTINAAQDDDAANDAAAISHTVSGADGYAGIAVASVNVSVTDDDTAGVTVSETSLSINEGESATYTVVLDTQPISDVGIAMFPYGVTVQPDRLTFTPDNWQTAQTVTVSAAQDEDTENVQGVIDHLIDAAPESAYADIGALPPVWVSVTDDDTAGQAEPGSVSVDPANILIREGHPAQTYTLVLDAQPTENVTVAVSSDNGDVAVQPSSLTFTPDNWQTAQTVTVSVSEDEDAANDHAVISHAASGGNYDGVTAPSVTVSVTDDDSPREVLRDFYNATGGANWANKDNWLSDRPLGEWHGVTVNGQGQVTQLNLRENNLSGSLPAALGNLEALQVLSLDRNSISGSLPTQLGNLSNLTRLALNRNQLTGAIPSELGNLSNLSVIGLARNSLSGTLPTQLGNLTGLTKLSLHDNTGLSGALPDGFVNLANLQRLAVANSGLCAPDTDAFRDWLDTVPDKPGGVPTCE